MDIQSEDLLLITNPDEYEFKPIESESVMYKEAKKGGKSKGELVRVGDIAMDTLHRQFGEVTNISTGQANYGTIIEVNMPQPVYYQPPPLPDGTLPPKTIESSAGIKYYTSGEWKNKFIKLSPEEGESSKELLDKLISG